jgi:hypothetical protein
LPGKGSPKRDKGKVCPFGRKVIESKLKYGFGCPKSASRKECEDILCNTRLKPLIIQRFPNLDVSDIDFSLWQNLYVDVHLVGTGSALIRSLESGYGDSQYELNISYSTGNQLCLIPTNAPNAQGNDTRLNFIIRSDASSRIEMQTFSMKPYWGVNTLRCYSDMKTMFFVADGTNSNLQAGSKLTVWGVK